MAAVAESAAPIKPLVGVPLPPRIDPANEHYPFCMVWTTIPVLSWLFPFIGHIAICDSQGKIYDFQGDYRIGCDRMLFGKVVRYWDLSRDYVPTFYSCSPRDVSPEVAEQIRTEVRQYDDALARATYHFRQTQHYNLFTNNCHAYVSAAVNENDIKVRHLNTVSAAVGMFFNDILLNKQEIHDRTSLLVVLDGAHLGIAPCVLVAPASLAALVVL